MAGRKSDFTLTKLDDLFSTQEQRDEEKLSKIRDIPLTEIDDFPDHPFKVRDDEDMAQLIESIKERGVITPATVRQKEDGRYELISGHRRKRACELAGFDTLRCEVVELNRDEATILMVESNYQRSQILPSEKAFAYKMRSEAMKRQAGRPGKENSSPVGIDLRGKQSLDLMSEECGDSRNQIHRYIRLTNLVISFPTASIRLLSAMRVRIPKMLRLQSMTASRLKTSSFTVRYPVRRLPRTAKNSAVQLSDCLRLMKTSSDGKVEGFTFRVTGVNGYDRSFTTGKNGEIIIEGLRIGDYTISEVQDNVSASYVLPADKIATVKVGSTTVVEMHNELRDTPKTGDNSNVGLWTALAGLSALGIVGTAIIAYRKKKKEDNE